MCKRARNVLAAKFIPNNPRDLGEKFGSVAAWCPWCEDIHFHGAAGEGGTRRIEARGAHCHDTGASPFLEIDYELDVAGITADAATLLPITPIASPFREGKREDRQRPRLHRMLDANFARIRTAMLAAVTGKARICLRFDQVKLPDGGRLDLYSAGTGWDIRRDCEEVARGDGLISLGAALYGLPPGVVAVRLFEVATGVILDVHAENELQDAIEGWMDRGAPKRRSR